MAPDSPVEACDEYILAIDLGKYNSVSCHLDPGAKATRVHAFRTTPDDMRKLPGRRVYPFR